MKYLFAILLLTACCYARGPQVHPRTAAPPTTQSHTVRNVTIGATATGGLAVSYKIVRHKKGR